MGLQAVDLREIDKHAANVYEAIIAASKKARQINDEQKIEFNQQLTTVQQTNVDDDSEDFHNPEQMRISLEFEKRPKPHVNAMNQLLEGKVTYSLNQKVEKK